MKRLLRKELTNWKNDKNRLPLIIRGTRQVGKSFLVESFGDDEFEERVTINFEFQPELKRCFDSLDPQEIHKTLFALTGKKITPGKTLLFLDEIQECPNAIIALRYYKEKLPTQHVIAAGSLLEFILNDESFRMPVGRVQFLHLRPLSFHEFLLAEKEEGAIEMLNQMSLTRPIPSVIHESLLQKLKTFFMLGGMPAVVAEYIDSHDLEKCQQLQIGLINTYKSDFSKYASKINIRYLQTLYKQAPNLVGKQFKYVDVDRDLRAREIKIAIELLSKAHVITTIYASNASGLPLNALINEKRFKLLLLDVGLLNRTTNLDAEILLAKDLLLLNRGALAEQFVGQELLAYKNPYEDPELFYWENTKLSSQAEIDYVINVGSQIIPIEVKAGSTGRLKSLKQFMESKQIKIGVRISELPLSLENNILSLPMYAIDQLPKLLS